MSTSTPKPRKANPHNLAAGDRVGISVPLTRSGVIVGQRIVCRGTIKRLFVINRRDRLKAEVRWDDDWVAWVYTGKSGWEYVYSLVKLEEGAGIG